MRALPLAAFALMGCICTGTAEARNEVLHFRVAKVLESFEFKKIGDDVVFYFGNQVTPPVTDRLGQYSFREPVSGVGMSDETACGHALVAGLTKLRERALKQGGNAVIRVRSYIDPTDSGSEYECHAGNVSAWVRLDGMVAKITR